MFITLIGAHHQKVRLFWHLFLPAWRKKRMSHVHCFLIFVVHKSHPLDTHYYDSLSLWKIWSIRFWSNTLLYVSRRRLMMTKETLCVYSSPTTSNLVAVYKLWYSGEVSLSIQFLIHASSSISIFLAWRICMTPAPFSFALRQCLNASRSHSEKLAISRKRFLLPSVASHSHWNAAYYSYIYTYV